IPRPAGDNKITFGQQLHRLLPGADFHKCVNTDQKVQLVRFLQRALEPPYSLDRIVWLPRIGFQQGRDKPFFVGRCQGQHGKAMLELCERAITFVGRHIRGHKVNQVEIEFCRSSPRNREMAEMNRIECAAKQGQLHLLFLFLKAARLGMRRTLCTFLALRGETVFVRALVCSWLYVPARICATARPTAYFSSGIPLPVTADISYRSSFNFLQCFRNLDSFSGFTTSILDATTIIGLASNPAPKLASSSMITWKSLTGSGRPLESETSIRCTRRRVRSMCRRNCVPKPVPLCAPSIRPGMSATT